MSANKVISKTRQAYKFIEAHSDEFGAQTMCRVLGVARGGHYAWLDHPVSDQAQDDARLLKLIRESLIASHGIYAPPKKSCKTCVNVESRALRIVVNIQTWQGWLYLAAVMDNFSRKIVGRPTRPAIHRELVLDSVAKAARCRRPRKTKIIQTRTCSMGVMFGKGSERQTILNQT